jgi:transposase
MTKKEVKLPQLKLKRKKRKKKRKKRRKKKRKKKKRKKKRKRRKKKRNRFLHSLPHPKRRKAWVFSRVFNYIFL